MQRSAIGADDAEDSGYKIGGIARKGAAELLICSSLQGRVVRKPVKSCKPRVKSL